VLLTGMLDDGVAGLAEIKRRGGLVVVQDPATALFPSMPQNAIQRVDVDYVSPVQEMAGLLYKLAIMERSAMERDEPVERTRVEVTCPECRGPIWEERQGRIVEYRCRVGHVYSPLAMAQQHQETVERSLWATVVALEEAADIGEKLAPELAPAAAQAARKKRAQASVLKEMLGETSPP
jgi:two-component system chemotaxis response regulator CheB